MSPALILDTGVLLWMSQGSGYLGPRTRAMIEEADEGGSLSFSADIIKVIMDFNR
ncbi:MAG: hypothetical protein OXG52_04165 [bacterium]|nr:hypothetical protein [bacterium]